MLNPPPLIKIRKFPPGPPTETDSRQRHWNWHCFVDACRMGEYELDSHAVAANMARHHLIAHFARHHAKASSFPRGDGHHYISCSCNWVSTGERDEQSAELALKWHINSMRKALAREVAAEVAA